MANYGHIPYGGVGAPPLYLATPYGFPYGGGGWDVSELARREVERVFSWRRRLTHVAAGGPRPACRTPRRAHLEIEE